MFGEMRTPVIVGEILAHLVDELLRRNIALVPLRHQHDGLADVEGLRRRNRRAPAARARIDAMDHALVDELHQALFHFAHFAYGPLEARALWLVA